MAHHMFLSRSTLAGILLFICGRGAAQCGIQVDWDYLRTDCSNYIDLNAGLTISGGAPPYALLFTSNSGWTTTAQVATSGTYWSGHLATGEVDHMVTLTITDGSGCIHTEERSYTPHLPFPPAVTGEYSCTLGGGILRWLGTYSFGSDNTIVSQCPGPFSYHFWSGSGGSVNGMVAEDWYMESPGVWRYAQLLPPEGYIVDIFSSVPSGECGMPVECYAPTGVTIAAPPGGCSVNFRLRAALAGALPSGTVMTAHLSASGLVPATEPYTALGYAWTGSVGGVTAVPAVLTATGNDAVVDWVLVELRRPTSPFAIVYSEPALLQRDGDVVDADGNAFVHCPVAPGNYRVAVRHRNHLGVMTGTAIALTANPSNALIDLRLSGTTVHGTNARTAVNGVMCLWPGDGGFDGRVKYTGDGNDRDPILQRVGGVTPTATVPNVYSPVDMNLDGVVKYTGDANDRDIILQTIGGVVPTAVRTAQLL